MILYNFSLYFFTREREKMKFLPKKNDFYTHEIFSLLRIFFLMPTANLYFLFGKCILFISLLRCVISSSTIRIARRKFIYYKRKTHTEERGTYLFDTNKIKHIYLPSFSDFSARKTRKKMMKIKMICGHMKL